MRFTLITLLASLSASAVHSSTIGSGSLVTRAGQKSMSDALNNTSGNGSSIGTTTNSSSVGGSKKPKPDHKTPSGNGSSIGSSTNATSGNNGTDSSPDPDDDLTGSSNSTGNGTSNPLLGPLPKNATIEERITRLEAKLADHKQKLQRAESKLVIEKQKLVKLGGGNHTTNSSAPIVSPPMKNNRTGTGNSSMPIGPHIQTKSNMSGSNTTPSKKNSTQ
ncbi:uncharacterized protein MELLADRAFT_96075 [Melampsora larici-populina 98AG31]|uniref:Secreted protein n=1 Tax=Melampsora larici-populina (strain 98AG31 / pathotype 3-4-7) TaxID=747676 RepID=F4SAV5_MELLP|nr:uncharacterized protein MELLADRAFT_96075 [Melampsora larici-populina 98AG31]EGF98233.1 secreted protein [Melampsora larici-populina 98AG31]